MYQGLWAVRASHSTATLSPGGICGLYGLRLMHRLNIFLSRSGPRAGRAPFLLVHCPNPNPSIDEYNYIFNNITKYLWTAFEDEQKKKARYGGACTSVLEDGYGTISTMSLCHLVKKLKGLHS
jgi:hypothetical protein